MKTKTINKVLTQKVFEWTETITDKKLRAKVRKDVVITGGCITSMLMREPVNDYDVYFRTHKTTLAVAKYYLKKFNAAAKKRKGKITPITVIDEEGRVSLRIPSEGIASEGGTEPFEYFEGRPDEAADEYNLITDPAQIQETFEQTEALALRTTGRKKPDYRPIFLSTNAITLSDKIQLVIRFYGKPDEIHENYDYVHCMNYWTPSSKVVLNPDALEAILTKELRYVGSLYPLCSLIRMRKFIQRGWSVNAGQILKMVMQLNELDLQNPAVLEDQLTGVDSAYFISVMNLMKEKNPERIEGAYLVEIIDRMF